VHPRQTLRQRLIGVLLADPQQAVSEARTVLALVGGDTVVDKGLTKTIVNLVETILVYKLPMLSREEIQAMLELTDIDLKQTRFYQEVFTEGRQEEGTTLSLRLLQRRCGGLAPALTERVAQLSLPQLAVLGEALLEFRGNADLERWLATHPRE
jgi:predicted transposase YdaD